jgi:hypothetical protein
VTVLRHLTVALPLLVPGSEALPPPADPPGLVAEVRPAPVTTLQPPSASVVPATATAPMVLGVQTHFSQGWSPTLIDRVRSSGAMSVRDGIPWSSGEPTPGRFALDTAAPAALDAICQTGGTLVLAIAPHHPAYDGGQTAHSDAAVAAFARYAGTLGDRYRNCLAGIEIGNEINDPRNLPNPPAVDGPARYVALLRGVKRELRRRGSSAAVLGGSTNVVATGFLDTLFAAGLLDVADAVVVHPYRSQAENVDREIAHLVDVMRRRGRVLPIWATEFSDNYATPEIASEELVKMVVLLSASGVARAYWYALIDQRWFRNMGLYASGGDEKPAARAYSQIIPLTRNARAVAVELGDPGIRLYRFGADAYVLWGAGGRVAFAGTPTVRDAYGRSIRHGTGVEATSLPLIVTGAGAPQLAASSNVVADTMSGYGRAPWSYLAQTRDGAMHPLALADGQWESSFSSRAYQPLKIGDVTAAVAGTAATPVRALIRYTAPSAARVSIAGCFIKQPKGDGVDIAISAAGRTLWRGVLTTQATLSGIEVDLTRNAALDISIGPNQTAGGDAFAYRVRLYARGAGRAVACPHRPDPVG